MGEKSKFETVKEIWRSIKKAILQVVGGLVAEKKDNIWVISMTKTATWVLLGHCLYVWNRTVEVADATSKMDVSQGELYTLWALLGIVGVVKIGAKTVNDAVAAWVGKPPATPESDK